MKALSLKLRDDVFKEVEEMVKKVHSSRNAYINDALAFYNRINRRKALRKQFARESRLIRASSLEVLREMDALIDEGIE